MRFPKPKHVRKRPTSFPALAGMFLPHPVNEAQSNRHDTASRRGVTGARGVNPAKPDREVLPDGRTTPATASPRQPERCRAREREERTAGLAADQANGRDVCTVGAHSRRIARRFLGAGFEVTAFDGWSLRSPAKMALETLFTPGIYPICRGGRELFGLCAHKAGNYFRGRRGFQFCGGGTLHAGVVVSADGSRRGEGLGRFEV